MTDRSLRRQGARLATLLLAAALVGAGVAAAGTGKRSANLLQRENALKGAVGWVNTNGPPRVIEVYASQISALPGQVMQFHVSTFPAARYRVEIYRLGYYRGIGGRLLACSPSCAGDRQGHPQPIPKPDPTTGLIQDHW